jgi:hypothetical protein
MPIPSFFLPNFERGHLLPFGRFNSINSVTEDAHSIIYGIAKFSFDLACGNYSDDSETKRKEFEAKLAQKNNVESDELLKSLRRQNEKPIPPVYKDLIIEVETAVAGNYGGGSISPGIRPPVGMSRGITPNRPLTADKSISETLKKTDDMVKVGPNAGRPITIAPKGIEFPAFRPGDSITKALPDGSCPRWFAREAAEKANTIQGRYWMNRAVQAGPGEFTQRQLARMRAGFAPEVQIRVRLPDGTVETRWASKELHHNLGNRGVPPFDEPIHLREVWPWQHSQIDRFRHTGYEFLGFVE